MSDMGDDFAALRERTRQIKTERRDRGLKAIDALTRKGHAVRALSDWQFRVDGLVDFYPTNRRYHILKTGERGRYADNDPGAVLRRAKVVDSAR